MELTCTGWVSVETEAAPCVNELKSKGKTISTKGVDGLILKHWATFQVRHLRGSNRWKPSGARTYKTVHRHVIDTLEQLSFVTEYKWYLQEYDLLLKFDISKEDRVKVIKLGVSDGFPVFISQ